MQASPNDIHLCLSTRKVETGALPQTHCHVGFLDYIEGSKTGRDILGNPISTNNYKTHKQNSKKEETQRGNKWSHAFCVRVRTRLSPEPH